MSEREVTAEVTHEDVRDSSQQIKLSTGHEIQFGGAGGDGFCYAHQSFDCVENLTDAERAAVREAESPDPHAPFPRGST